MVNAHLGNGQIGALLPPLRNRLFQIFHGYEYRPFIWDECYKDIGGVISNTAHRYCDPSRVSMHVDELVAEGWLKVAKLKDKGLLDKLPNRREAFKYITTCVNNNARGILQKEVFTIKRTGVKSTKKGAGEVFTPEEVHEYAPRNTVSIDDETQAYCVKDEGAEDLHHNTQLLTDFKSVLSPMEKLVLEQLLQPSSEAFCYATVDAHRGRELGKTLKIDIKPEHYAASIGVPKELFLSVQGDIQEKYTKYMKDELNNENGPEIRKLESIFGVQIPNSLPSLIVRRLLTLAARDQNSKVTPEVSDLLKKVGAKPPAQISPTVLGCYGVLYQEGHRICNSCGLRVSCATEAANVGLGSITLAPKLLGQKLTRIPAIIAGKVKEEPEFQNTEEEEVFSYLVENFDRDDDTVVIGFSPKDTPEQTIQVESPFRVRILRPRTELYPMLEKQGRFYYLPENLSAHKSIRIIELHTQHAYHPATTNG